MEAQTKAAHELTEHELRALLAKKEADNKEKLEQERITYETNRDDMIIQSVNNAIALHEILTQFKQDIHEAMDAQAEKLAEYGMIRGNSKGGFGITNSDNNMRLIRRRDTEPMWDERSKKAIELILDFLSDTIKKQDVKTYEILMSYIQLNEKGELEYSRVMTLLQHEDKYDDPRWIEGLRLMKQSYSNHFKGFGYEFKIKGADGKWKNILLNFSSL